MPGWFARKVNNWASKRQRKDLEDFLLRLRAMDGEEIGHLVAVATHVRHKIEAKGHSLLDPLSNEPWITAGLSKHTVQLQKEGDLVTAAGLMVWVHTLRAGSHLEIRQLGRNMWRELERGFPHVEDAALGAVVTLGVELNTDGSDSIPLGLNPEVQ